MGLVAPWHVGSSRTGLEPVSTALAGRLPTTAPPGKSPPLTTLLGVIWVGSLVYFQVFFITNKAVMNIILSEESVGLNMIPGMSSLVQCRALLFIYLFSFIYLYCLVAWGRSLLYVYFSRLKFFFFFLFWLYSSVNLPPKLTTNNLHLPVFSIPIPSPFFPLRHPPSWILFLSLL